MFFRRARTAPGQKTEKRPSSITGQAKAASISPEEAQATVLPDDEPIAAAQEMPPDDTDAKDRSAAAMGDEQIIQAVYRGFLGRDPDPAGLRHHTALLHADGLEAVIRDAIASSEFQGLMRNALMQEAQPVHGPAEVAADAQAKTDAVP